MDDWEEEDRIAAGRPALLDLSQLDLSVKVTISLKIFKVVLNQATLIRFFDLLNNNILFKDKYSDQFEISLSSQADSPNKKAHVPPYNSLRQDKMTVDLKVKAKCLSLEMRDFNKSLISEVCIVGLEF